MSKKCRLMPGIATGAISFLLLVLLMPMATAQHEVEIEIAGPWDYVPDYSNPKNIIIFSPVTYHSMIAFDGGDINDTANGAHHPLVAEAGIHQLNLTFNPGDCAASLPTPPVNKLYAIAADRPKITTVLANTGQRFAVSLPRPCWYESYSEARAKIDTSAISVSTQENSYTTWMVFHYTVQNSVTTATLNVNNDSTPGVTTRWPLTFSQTFPPRSAITIDMYFSSMTMENYTCDQHSADFFDIDVGPTFWNKSNFYRLYPELDHTRLQTNHYNYDQTVCPQAVTVSTPPGSQIPSHIYAIRKLLTKEHAEEAKSLLTKLRSEAAEFWDGSALATVNQDIDAASHTIDNATKADGPCTEAVAAQLLRITLYLYDNRSPGRADCHKMQFNVANAIQ